MHKDEVNLDFWFKLSLSLSFCLSSNAPLRSAPCYSHTLTHVQRENLLKVSDDNMSGLGLSLWRSIGWPASGG